MCVSIHTCIPGGILSGKINFGKILPGKNSVPELFNGVKICPLGVWKGKKEIRREVPKKFLVYILDEIEIELFLKKKKQREKFCPEA